MTPTIVVNEIFGPTFQGEGPSVGRQATFLRLGGCNLHCIWCDTKYTWDWSQYDPRDELHSMSIDEVAGALTQSGSTLLVVTGGEPMLQQKALEALFLVLTYGMPFEHIEIETAGTMMPVVMSPNIPLSFNVSPKLENSGNEYQKRFVPGALAAFTRRKAIFKFVATDAGESLDEIAEIQRQIGINSSRIYVMPEGVTRGDIDHGVQKLALEVLRRGWNLSTRLQVIIWGQRRGV